MKEKRSGKRKRKRHLGIAAVTLAVCAALAAGFYFYSVRASEADYAVTVAGDRVCTLDNKTEAEKAIKIALKGLAARGSSIKAVSSGSLKIDKCDSNDPGTSKDTPGAAAIKIRRAVMSSDPGGDGDEDLGNGVCIASVSRETRTFTPEPQYVKDDTMLAGQSEITEDSVDGEKEVLITYVTVNGEIDSKTETVLEMIDEGRQATIHKGTIGLPEGEDWKTYEGDPICVIGDAIGNQGLTHLGVPYSKWDCVEFLLNTFREMGIKLPRTHRGIQSFGYGVPYSKARKGDIICYRRHVGIYLGNGKMVHSTSSGGVHVGRVETSKVVTVRRYIKH